MNDQLPKDNEKQIFGIVPTKLFYTQEPILAPIVKRKLYCKTVALDCISFRVIPHKSTVVFKELRWAFSVLAELLISHSASIQQPLVFETMN